MLFPSLLGHFLLPETALQNLQNYYENTQRNYRKVKRFVKNLTIVFNLSFRVVNERQNMNERGMQMWVGLGQFVTGSSDGTDDDKRFYILCRLSSN